MRGAYPVVLTVLMTACGSQGLASGGYTRPPPTPEPEATVVVTDEVVLVPSANDLQLGGFQIVGTVENTGNAWAKLRPGRSEWTALDESGGTTARGPIARAYPQYLEPGGIGYLVTYDVQEGIDTRKFVTLEISPEYQTVSDPAVTFRFPDTQVTYDDPNGLTARGVLTASSDRPSVNVAVICLDSAGKVLAVADGRVARVGQALIDQRIIAWQEHPFETLGPPTDLQAGSCASTVIEASANDR